MSRHFRKESMRQRRGSVIMAMALSAFVLCGFAGLALDVSYFHMLQRKAQTAADAAAMAAALELKRTHNSEAAVAAALNDAGLNGFQHGAGATVSVESPPRSGEHSGDSRYALVRVRKDAPAYFMRLFGHNSVTISAHSVSGLAQTGACVYVLDPAQNNAMQLGGGPVVNMSCGVQVNSNSESALQVTGGATVSTPGFHVVGGVQLTSGTYITPEPVTGMPFEDDPLSWHAMPEVPSSCDHVHYKVNGERNNANPLNLNPGVYCGGIDISTGRQINFGAGLYILAGGGLKISSQSAVSGTDVTFFNTATANRGHGPVSITGGGMLNLRAPRSGNWESLLIFEDRRIQENSPNHVEGQTGSNIEGILYMPNSILNYAGGSGTTAAYTGIVARTLTLTGQSRFNANYAVLGNGPPLVRSALVD